LRFFTFGSFRLVAKLSDLGFAIWLTAKIAET